MAEFDELRAALAAARGEREAAHQGISSARENLGRLQRQQAAFARTFDAQDPHQQEQMAQLEKEIQAASHEVERTRSLYTELSLSAAEALKSFGGFSDPREWIGQFSDRYPVLLLPLRIETRFKTAPVPGAPAGQPQLWVRVYPDTCAVDSFEAVLSEAEIHSAKIFWQAMWAAGGVEDQERGAWSGLVASHGAGRGAWIAKTYLPENGLPPAKADPQDVILVVATETPLVAAEQDALRVYWEAAWLVDGAEAPVAAAFQALTDAVGAERAAELVAQYVPFNLAVAPTPPKTKADVVVTTAFLDFPSPETVESKGRSWSQAPKVNVLPERLVLIGYLGGKEVLQAIGAPITSPLVVGPDPSAAEDEGLRAEDGDLIFPDEMKWMVDFEQALQVGMAFRVSLTPEQASAGFDRLLVLGVRLSADEQGGRELVETLFEHHHYSRTGISLLPQGTPTNNTEKGGSGFSASEDSDDTFMDYFKSPMLYTPEGDLRLRRDGQWLADLLGIRHRVVQKIKGSGGTDQLEARAMNTALWSGTLGYMMETMMAPLFKPEDIRFTRAYFTNLVSGRGPLPALRIGAQPYGILPTSVFSRLGWLSPRRDGGLGVLTHAPAFGGGFSQLSSLYAILQKMDAHWQGLAEGAAFVGKNGDPHQILLDVLGLHPTSVEYHQRYAESFDHLFNLMNLYGLGGKFLAALIAGAYVQSGKDLLAELGYQGDSTPDVLERLFLSSQHLMQGPVVDDRPLSEAEPVRAYTADERNYLQWLIDAARTSLETLRRQDGFLDNQSPRALLYILLRYALMQSYWESSLSLHRLAQIFDDQQLLELAHEPAFIHVHEKPQANESRFAHLYTVNPVITGQDNLLVADHITRLLPKSQEEEPQAVATAELREQVEALELLKDLPTARLERLFAEHIDTCSYRLDAWELGLLTYQLLLMRSSRQGEGDEGREPGGLYLGAYGWVEELRPEDKDLSPVELPEDLEAVFNSDPDQPELMRDPTNGGYIHAPSLNHAVTAAILRNGYISNASPASPDALAVNLSSDRVRRTLAAIEGIRNGQSLGALLGYQFERGLHDSHNLAEVDEFIYDLRIEFPLRAKQLQDTLPPEDASIEAIEARNVMDGLKLVEHIRASGIKTYPFGKSLPVATDDQKKAINAEVERMLDTHDAVSDVAIAESVHHAVQGNYDRAAGTLDTYTKGNFPPIPDVIQTPRSGIGLTQRVGLHLQAGLDPLVSPVAGMAVTPRGQAEPALNSWLASVLPDPGDVVCTVVVTDPVSALESTLTISQRDLGLQPIDLLYVLSQSNQPALAELDERLLRRARQVASPRPDAALRIDYTTAVTGKITFFELMPLVASLRRLALSSRPLRPTDVLLVNEANAGQDEAVSLDRGRLVTAQARLQTLQTDVSAYQAALQALMDDLENRRSDVLSGIDVSAEEMAALLERASLAGVPQSGWGFIYQRSAGLYSRSLQAVRTLIERWQTRLDNFDALISQYDALPLDTPEEDRYSLLIQAENWVTTLPENPLPATPAAFRAILMTKRSAFSTRHEQFKDMLDSTQPLAGLLADLRALLPVSDFDLEPFQITALEDAIVLFAGELLSQSAGLALDLQGRVALAQAQLDAHDTSASPLERVAALQAGTRALFGDDFKLIPEFSLGEAQTAEWQKAYNDNAGLLTYLIGDLNVDFPVDDWLYGVARVREKMRHWERAVVLSEGFGAATPALTPVQFPYRENDRWLAMEYPPDLLIDGDRLLYTAHYAVPFDPSQSQCGLLLDEWTEVIPGEKETTGITFHYDRPNAEPPQVMLLVTPPQFTGSWRWQDLVDALHETLEMARKRAVEPAHVDDTAFARFLPATVMAVTLYGISISANLAANNAVYNLIRRND